MLIIDFQRNWRQAAFTLHNTCRSNARLYAINWSAFFNFLQPYETFWLVTFFIVIISLFIHLFIYYFLSRKIKTTICFTGSFSIKEEIYYMFLERGRVCELYDNILQNCKDDFPAIMVNNSRKLQNHNSLEFQEHVCEHKRILSWEVKLPENNLYSDYELIYRNFLSENVFMLFTLDCVWLAVYSTSLQKTCTLACVQLFFYLHKNNHMVPIFFFFSC